MYVNQNVKDEEDKIKYNLENSKKIEKIFSKKLLEYSSLINNNKMNLQEWVEFMKTKSQFELNGKKEYYFYVYENVPKSNESILLTTGYKSNIYDSLLWSDVYKLKSSDKFNDNKNMNDKYPEIMIKTAQINKVNSFSYFNLDGYTNETVIKKVLYTKWKTTDGKDGIIGIGYDTYDITYENEFKYIELIHKPELVTTSVLLFVISLVIYHVDAFKFSKKKSILFLFISNLYLLYFINMTEIVSNYENEKNNIQSINSKILGISFLSTVNLFVINYLESNKKLFVETVMVYSVSILLLLIALYQSINQNTMLEIIGVRITNQLVFNFAILLNFLTIVNFIVHTINSNKPYIGGIKNIMKYFK